MAASRYVIPNGNGWDVVKEGHLRGTTLAKTKAQAVARAREVVRREGGGEVLVMNRAGKITDAKSVAPPRRKAASA